MFCTSSNPSDWRSLASCANHSQFLIYRYPWDSVYFVVTAIRRVATNLAPEAPHISCFRHESHHTIRPIKVFAQVIYKPVSLPFRWRFATAARFRMPKQPPGENIGLMAKVTPRPAYIVQHIIRTVWRRKPITSCAIDPVCLPFR